MELLHAFYTNMTQMAVPQVGGTISLLSYIFWHENVYHYDRDSINHSFRCKTIEGIIQINRVTIILLK